MQRKKKKKDFSSWEFFGVCECKRSETDAGGIITYCKLFVSDKEGKKTIVYSLTFAKLSRDKAVVKKAPQAPQCCAKIRGTLQCSATWMEAGIPIM